MADSVHTCVYCEGTFN